MLTTDTDLLSESELVDWFQIYQPLPDHKRDALDLGEDRALFVAGTLCLLNGQRTLWNAIFETVYYPAGGDTPDMDAMTWLANQTAFARLISRQLPSM